MSSPPDPDASAPVTSSTLDPDDVVLLESHGLITPPSSGTRRINKRALRSSSSEESYIPTQTLTDTVSIPQERISEATFCYLGLSSSAASECWQAWLNFPADMRTTDSGPYRFLSFANAHIRNAGPDAQNFTDDWRGAMTRLGLSEELIEAIMDPQFTNIRMTQSAKTWAIESFELRFRSLAELFSKSAARAKQFRKIQRNGEASSKASSSAAAVEDQKQTSLVDLTLKLPTKAEDHIMLFKGVDKQRCVNVLKDDSSIESLNSLVSVPTGDFASRKTGFYFTPEKEVAEKYARFAGVRSKYSDVCIVVLQVPNNFITTLRRVQLWFSETDKTWSEYVWNCRRNNAPPEHLMWLTDMQLIIGSIAGANNDTIQALQSPSQITREHLLRRDNTGGAATQYFFDGLLQSRLERECAQSLTLCNVWAK